VKKKKFEGQVLSGHKEVAVEAPFDPSQEWMIQPQRLWHGRRGYLVIAKINGVTFGSAIVPWQRKFFLLIDEDSRRAAQISEGDMVRVMVKLHP